MAIRKIVQKDDPVLRKKARVVENIDERICELLDDMAETMYDADGCGLAAPQVGILKRIAVVDIGDGLIELINPEIISAEGEQDGVEGCLSVKGVQGYVKRPNKLVVRAYDRNGDYFEYTPEGFLARAFNHEIDHLDGILYIDKVHKYVEGE